MMSAHPTASAPAPRRRLAAWFILSLCLIAAVRVGLYSLAFPYFNNVDEDSHYDLILKYERGAYPRQLELLERDFVHNSGLYATYEFIYPPEQMPGGRHPLPLWRYPQQFIEETLPLIERSRMVTNHETTSPPFYYLVGAGWNHLGRSAGIGEPKLIYWTRCMNVLVFMLLVWISYRSALIAFPNSPFLHYGTPIAAAFYPQDTFYCIQSDVISPLCFGLGFLALLHWLHAKTPSRLLSLIAGLLIGSAAWAKIVNVAPIGAVLVFLVLWAVKEKPAEWRIKRGSFCWLVAAMLTLVVSLVVWNQLQFGDPTGTSAKIKLLGWSPKPINEWGNHPLFSFTGFTLFWRDVSASFWRGELCWGGKRLAFAWLDQGFCVATSLSLTCAIAGLWFSRRDGDSAARHAVQIAVWSLLGGIVLLALLSIRYDFHQCAYPSTAYPYFSSGRLLAAVIVPFLLLFLYSIDRAVSWCCASEFPKWTILIAVVLVITVATARLYTPVFYSEYNWFHLPASASGG